MNTVISVENLGKKYTLHHQQRESYTALRDVLANGAASIGQKILHPFRKPPTAQQTQEDFWALRDVSFEVKQGDRIGIIGRNGAGKSTLLKILSRITEPTSGRVKIKGRVASLLEVGTGFHPELTGRENIFLNGAILGMSRVEIKNKFDEIVDFAEIEQFLDTPVKRYSSGMYVRLAFAVAAHLEPEILVVDEVLAVGDAEFQKKCLGKMNDVSKYGRTVLFVSHNMSAIEQLTSLTLMFEQGRLVKSAPSSDCINHYLSRSKTAVTNKVLNHEGICINLHAINEQGSRETSFKCGTNIKFKIECCSSNKMTGVDFQIAIFTTSGYRLLTLSSRCQSTIRATVVEGQSRIVAIWLNPCLAPGEYHVALGLWQHNHYLKHWEDVLSIEIIEQDYYATGKMPEAFMGPILPHCLWEM